MLLWQLRQCVTFEPLLRQDFLLTLLPPILIYNATINILAIFNSPICNAHFDHNVRVKYVWREKHPENIIDQKTSQQKSGHFKTRKSDKGNKCYTESHSHCYKNWTIIYLVLATLNNHSKQFLQIINIKMINCTLN